MENPNESSGEQSRAKARQDPQPSLLSTRLLLPNIANGQKKTRILRNRGNGALVSKNLVQPSEMKPLKPKKLNSRKNKHGLRVRQYVHTNVEKPPTEIEKSRRTRCQSKLNPVQQSTDVKYFTFEYGLCPQHPYYDPYQAFRVEKERAVAAPEEIYFTATLEGVTLYNHGVAQFTSKQGTSV